MKVIFQNGMWINEWSEWFVCVGFTWERLSVPMIKKKSAECRADGVFNEWNEWGMGGNREKDRNGKWKRQIFMGGTNIPHTFYGTLHERGPGYQILKSLI